MTARSEILLLAAEHGWAIKNTPDSRRVTLVSGKPLRYLHLQFTATGSVSGLEIAPVLGGSHTVYTDKRRAALEELARKVTSDATQEAPKKLTAKKIAASDIRVGDWIRLKTADGTVHEFEVGTLPRRVIYVEPVNAPGVVFELAPLDTVERFR